MSSQTAVETPVKKCIWWSWCRGQSTLRGQPGRSTCVAGRPWLVKCQPCIADHRCFSCTYIIYKRRRRRGQQGSLSRWGVPSYRELTSNCVRPCGETNTAIWGELMPQQALMTTCWDSLRHADSQRNPTPSSTLIKPTGIYSIYKYIYIYSKYICNRNKAVSEHIRSALIQDPAMVIY